MSRDSIIALIVSIPVTILVSLMMPVIQDGLARLYFPIRIKRIDSILHEYQFLAHAKRDLSFFIGVLFRRLSSIIIYLFGSMLMMFAANIMDSADRFSLDIVIRTLYYTVFCFFVFSTTFGSLRSLALFRLAHRVNYFQTYETEVHNRVRRLGGTLTELSETQQSYSMKDVR